MNYTVLRSGAMGLYRCQDCGLVQRPQHVGPEEKLSKVDESLFGVALKQVLHKTQAVPDSSVLIIGQPPHSTLPLICESRLNVIVLAQHGEEAAQSSVQIQRGRLESAPFRPEQFDIILCARRADTLQSTASLLAKSRLWLRPGGLMFLSGINWGSLERTLFPGRWLDRHSSGRTFPRSKQIKSYAARHGFELLSSGTRSRIEDIATIAFDSPAPSFLTQAAVMPLWLASALPGLGRTWWGILVKREYTTRAVLRSLSEETDRAPGLAAAGYSSSPRERIEAEQ